MTVPCSNIRGIGNPADCYRRKGIPCNGSISKLAPPIIPPAFYPAIQKDYAGMRSCCCNTLGIGNPTDCHRDWGVGGRSITKLAEMVTSPAFHRTVLEDGTGVLRSSLNGR